MKKRTLIGRTICMLLCAAMLLPLAACAKKTDEAASGADQAQILKVVIGADVPNLDPNNDDNFIHYQVTKQMFESLFAYDENYNIVPWLCESYEYENDNTLIVHLNKGVKFHNGDELKASDVIFTYKRIVDNSLAALQQVKSLDMSQCEAVDDYTVKLVTTAPNPTLLNLLQHPSCAIISERACTEANADFANGACVGTGPFVFSSYTPGDMIELTAFSDYRREGEPKVDGVQFRIITDSAARSVEAETGGADIVYNIATNDMATVSAAENVTVLEDLATQTVHFMLNCAKAPLDDIRVREAICLAIDKEPAVKAGYANFGQVASGWVAPGIVGYEEVGYTRDVEKAKALLAEAGYADGFTMDVALPNTMQERANIAEAIQAQLAELGITLTLNIMDNTALASFTTSGQHFSTIQGFSCTDFEADRALGQIVPDAYYYGLYSIDNAAVADYYNQAINTMDKEARTELYKKSISEIMNSYIGVPLWHKAINAAVNDRVDGFKLDRSLEVHDLQYVYFK